MLSVDWTWQNGLQFVGGLAGLGGNYFGITRNVDVPTPSSPSRNLGRKTTRAPTAPQAPKTIPRTGEIGPNTHRQTGIVFPKKGAKELPLSKIEPLHDVPRSVKPEGYIDDLASKLQGGFDRSKGTADVFRMPDGTYRMANGNHRAEAMKRLGEKTIPSRILDWKNVPKDAQKWFRERFPELNWF